MRPFPLTALLVFLFAFTTESAWARQVHCESCEHHFGPVQVNYSLTHTFLLKNHGSRTLVISSVAKVQGTEFVLGNLHLPIRIQPGETIQIPVTFVPIRPGSADGTIAIQSNDPDSPLRLHVDGFGQPIQYGQLTVSPATLNFGNVEVGSTESEPATLTASNGNITIYSVSSSNSEFAITGLTPPITIVSGKSLQVTMQFSPKAPGTVDANATFKSSAGDSPTIESLAGDGVTNASHSAYLTWEAGAAEIAGYNIYRGTVHGGPYAKLNGALISPTNYTDNNVAGGKTYYYVATEVNDQGQESGYSSEAKAKIPK